ncbi:MAG: sigma-70 family RNA polymerase sigma factor [Phycisphaerales bacterium]|nr:MAG: sigma-70 family RNA polymerase sigma factor [Phycisphaerales bacterium]
MDTENADLFLVERIRDGDQAAWRQLIDRYQGRLLAFARSRAPSLADAEDVVQEALVGFAASLANYDESRSLETYLFTITRYKLFDLMRQKKLPIQQAPEEGGDWWDRAAPSAGETPSSAAAAAEATQAQKELLGGLLLRLIHELRDRQAFSDLQVIELIFFGGTRNLDVADLLGMDQKAVAGVKFRAIQKLRKFLEEGEPDAAACMEEERAEVTVSSVWREQRLTCLKRSTLGSYLLGLLEDPWKSYTQFHLDVVGCPMCVANLEDLQREEEDEKDAQASPSERFFASSVGFLRKA